MKIKTSLVGALICLLAQPALSDPIITYTVTNIGGNSFEYEYTVNNTFTEEIEEFSIFFDVGLFENLVITGSPVDWDGLAIQPDLFLPDDGFADWLALGALLGLGEILSDFSVSFDWLGGEGGPGDQFFVVLDPFTFEVLADGFTMAAGMDVPEPGTLGLFSLALLIGSFASRKRLLLHQ